MTTKFFPTSGNKEEGKSQAEKSLIIETARRNFIKALEIHKLRNFIGQYC